MSYYVTCAIRYGCYVDSRIDIYEMPAADITLLSAIAAVTILAILAVIATYMIQPFITLMLHTLRWLAG